MAELQAIIVLLYLSSHLHAHLLSEKSDFLTRLKDAGNQWVFTAAIIATLPFISLWCSTMIYLGLATNQSCNTEVGKTIVILFDDWTRKTNESTIHHCQRASRFSRCSADSTVKFIRTETTNDVFTLHSRSDSFMSWWCWSRILSAKMLKLPSKIISEISG